MKSKQLFVLSLLFLHFHLHAQNSTVNNLSLFRLGSDCLDMADAQLSIDSIFCNNGQVELLLSICNLGEIALPPNTPFSFYDGNPTTQNADLLAVGQTTGPIDSGACLQIIVQVSSDWILPGASLYAVVNDDGNLNTPFSLSNFPNTGIEECSYANNLDSFALVLPDPVAPDLGPDIILCTDKTITFHAGPGYAGYLWQDGSTDSTTTALDPGIYYVEVTGENGARQTGRFVRAAD